MSIRPVSSSGQSGGFYVVNAGTSIKPQIIVDYAASNAAILGRYPGKPVIGPWPTLADAEEAAHFLGLEEKVGVVIAHDARAAAGATGKTGQAVAEGLTSSPLSGIAEVGAVLRAFFSTVTDWHFWASLGWVILGILLVIMGLRLWLGHG